MGRIQNYVFLVLLLVSSASARADRGASFGYAGFQGEYSVSAVHEWSRRHAFDFGIGQYPIDGKRDYQANIGYRYSPWLVDLGGGRDWTPIGFGLSAMYDLSQRNYFVNSPGKYPSPGYYEQTGIRLGLEATTQVAAWNGRVRLLYRTVLLDSGVIALFNNDGHYASYFYSSGLALQYFF